MSNSLQRPHAMSRVGALLLAVFGGAFSSRAQSDEFPAPFDTEKTATAPMTPEESAAAWRLPPGFRASLFAGEPDVRQPIGMAFDGRGRLWVAENYTYAESGVNFDARLRDRIVILEDSNGDDRSDRRTVFSDRLERLTSVEVGFGGVWALAPPHLLFVPDRDGDDRPDSQPVVMLDGWNVSDVRHNVVNGLRWGPDGWLYGRHGILATSHVGTPETPESARTALNCCVWRFHPIDHRFEVVCQGTTNPWGMDWNEHGELFFINTVIGHLWHAVPGAHFRRMYGEDFNPHTYELIEQTADHVHWDVSSETWTATRTALSDRTSLTGGGHAHSGLMIYSGDNWPAEYRGDVFMLNFHGRRLNRDRLERHGATYAAHHQADPLQNGDPWFRGIDLASGPDGGVYVLDWSDTGECHDEDGVHRSSGRVFKITHDNAARATRATDDIATLSDQELVKLQQGTNEWHVRQSRRALQERFASGADSSDVSKALHAELTTSANAFHVLRAAWCLNAIGKLSDNDLHRMLRHADEHVRTWGVRFLTDRPTTDAAKRQSLELLAESERSGLVLTYLASALQRLPHADRWKLATALARHQEFADDRVLPLLIWYGVEPAVTRAPDPAAALAGAAGMSKLTRFIARRLTGDLHRDPHIADGLVELLRGDGHPGVKREVLAGMNDAVRGWRKAPAPRGWIEFSSNLDDDDAEMVRVARDLSAVFGDGRALDELRRMVADSVQPLLNRREAIRTLVQARSEGLSDLLQPLLLDRELADEAVRGLAATSLVQHQDLLLSQYGKMPAKGREAVIEALVTRVDAAHALLDAVAAGRVLAAKVPPFALRQMQLLGDAALTKRLAEIWPEANLLDGEKLTQIARYREQLQSERLSAADLKQGRILYAQHCGKCHKLFGEGGAIGPELTGAQRDNLDYWLQNIVDPSATVGTNYRLSVIALTDGRVLNGVVGAQSERTVAIQTATESLVLERVEIDEIQPAELSLMPEGQFNSMSDDQIRDLVAYLMSNR